MNMEVTFITAHEASTSRTEQDTQERREPDSTRHAQAFAGGASS